MPVITLTPPLLTSASCQLARRVMDNGFYPRVVIGILNGGAHVARQMMSSFPEGTLHCEVSISRPSTVHKQQSYAHRLLRHIPLWLSDILRIIESRFTEFRSSHSTLDRIGNLTLPAEVEDVLHAGPCPVLIVDDAIDSGATIQKVRKQLSERFPNLDVKVSVITVTTPHPACDADYYLYHNRTLCRFPWSNDYR